MRRTTRALIAIPLAVVALVLTAGGAAAHPLGNFTVNRYDGLLVSPDTITVDHVLDLAEIPSVQVRETVDRDANGKFSASELDAWAKERCAQEAANLVLTVGDRTLPLTIGRAAARSLPGQAGLPILRLECLLSGPTIVDGQRRISFRDNGTAQVGWREITERGDGMLLQATADEQLRTTSPSKRLSAYPNDLLTSPLTDRQVTFTAQPGGARASDAQGDGTVLSRPSDRLGAAFTSLVGQSQLGTGAVALALLLALAIGAGHAVAPGHGKTIMAFYLAGRGDNKRRSARAAVTVGATVTLTHTAGVLVLGLLVAGAAHVASAAIYPWLGALSGVIIAAVGVMLLRQALRQRRSGGSGHAHPHPHGGPGHRHPHPHGNDGHAHPDGGHGHDRPETHDDHGHAHPGHDHSHAGHDHPHTGHDHPHEGSDRPQPETEPAFAHVHGLGADDDDVVPIPAVSAASPAREAALTTLVTLVPSMHHHHDNDDEHADEATAGSAHEAAAELPRTSGGRASLIAMGVAGGMVPSPSALVVLLGAAAVGRAWLGVLLVVAFGVGMATTLCIAGLLVVAAGDRLAQSGRTAAGGWAARALAVAPLVTAAAVCLLGAYLVVRGLWSLP